MRTGDVQYGIELDTLSYILHHIVGKVHRKMNACDCVVKRKPFPKQALVFACLQYKSFENTVGKGEIARYEQYLLYPQCFLPIWKSSCYFHQIQNCHLQTLKLEDSESIVCKCLRFGPL